MRSTIGHVLRLTGLQYLPVRVRNGPAKGARWTLYPFSANWRGHTEPEIECALKLIGSLEGKVCWDLGAHFGIYTAAFAIATGPAGRVYAFEPSPLSYRRCIRHVQMNGFDWVMVFNAAVGATAGRQDFLIGEEASASTPHFAYEDEDATAAKKIPVDVVSLDSLVQQGKILPADLIKVDVEGYGAHAMKGAERTLAKAHPMIVMSFHSTWELAGTRSVLEPIGYEAFDELGLAIGWDAALHRTAILKV